jgi:hypothetical protein
LAYSARNITDEGNAREDGARSAASFGQFSYSSRSAVVRGYEKVRIAGRIWVPILARERPRSSRVLPRLPAQPARHWTRGIAAWILVTHAATRSRFGGASIPSSMTLESHALAASCSVEK